MSYFFVRVISVLSLCYLCYLLLSLCYLLAISVLSLCYLCVISVLSLCYLYGISTLSQKKWILSVASPVFWKADCGSFLLCGFHDVLSAFNSLLLRLLWFSGMAAHNHSHKLQMFNASVHIAFPRRAQTICTMCSKKKRSRNLVKFQKNKKKGKISVLLISTYFYLNLLISTYK